LITRIPAEEIEISHFCNFRSSLWP